MWFWRSKTVRVGAAAAVAAATAFLVGSWLLIEWDEDVPPYPGGVVLRDAAGEVMRVSLGEHDVDCRPYYEPDPDDWVVKALLAAEDGTFWTHCGVRPFSALRAAWQNLVCRRRISGASTITMQAVRLIRPHPKSLWWKWKETVMALKMERRRDKRWILAQYLNRAPYGSNFIGVEAAANGWFGKGARELGPAESAMLAAMVQAPSRLRPDRGCERAIRRRDWVLERMRRLGMLTDGQLAAAKQARPAICRAPRPFRHPHYCDWMLAKMGRGRAAQRLSGDVRTPLLPDVQRTCEQVVAATAAGGGPAAAAVVVRVATGEVVALACSGDYFDARAGQVNTALAPRPAGSTLKPFLLALALDRGLVTPDERLADVPRAYRGYRPANFDASHRGLVTARDALVLSLNVPFVEMLRRTGTAAFADALRALGFSRLAGSEEPFGLGLAIGNAEVTLVELTSAYAALARGGDGIFSRGACHLVSDILSGNERSAAALGHVADVEVSRFAWKTGTSSAYRDAWTVAWNPEWAVGVWRGRLRGGFGDKTVVGAKAAAPACWRIVRSLCPRADGPWFVEPDEVVRRRICALTGLPANPDCPAVEEGRALRGRSAQTLCPVHARDADGRPVERLDAFLAAFAGKTARAAALALAKPEADATFHLVPGVPQQRIVCQPLGNPDGSKLWWFVDGRPVGSSEGGRTFAAELGPGDHVITCATADGVDASVEVHVAE